MIRKDRINQKGFTLIELLAVIVIISVIVSIAGYAVVSAIRSSKDKANEISYESIKKSAELYVKEYSTNINWNSSDDFEYSCILINDLINKGYLKKEDISGVETSYIQVNRDMDSKVIIEEIIAGDRYVCS